MKFVNIFDTSKQLGGAECVVNDGVDGGQYVPSSFPYLGKALISELEAMPFPERVAKILSLYFDIPFDALKTASKKAYEDFEDEGLVLLKVEDGPYLAKLCGGPSCEYRDFSAAIFPYLLEECKKAVGEDRPTVVLSADAVEGTTALAEAFSRSRGAHMLGFYPLEGSEEIGSVSLVTGEYVGVSPIGVRTSLDKLHRELRRAISSMDLSDYHITRARGVNMGRTLPLVACFVSAYCDLVEAGEIDRGEYINFAVSAGDFTLALACYYAFRMGLPIGCILLASNANNSVSDFFSTGELRADREFYHTMSSALDVLVPEALLDVVFELVGRDGERMRELNEELLHDGGFLVELDDDITGIFQAGWADEDETRDAIANAYDIDDCIIDPNTAVAASVYNEYALETEDDAPAVVMFVSSPYLYANSVLECIDERKAKDGFRAIKKLGDLTAAECPDRLEQMYLGEVKCDERISPEEISDRIEKYIRSLG